MPDDDGEDDLVPSLQWAKCLVLCLVCLWFAAVVIDEGMVSQLAGMGFDLEGCKKAVYFTHNQGTVTLACQKFCVGGVVLCVLCLCCVCYVCVVCVMFVLWCCVCFHFLYPLCVGCKRGAPGCVCIFLTCTCVVCVCVCVGVEAAMNWVLEHMGDEGDPIHGDTFTPHITLPHPQILPLH